MAKKPMSNMDYNSKHVACMGGKSVSSHLNPKDHNIMMPTKDRDNDGKDDESVDDELSEDTNASGGI